MSCGIHNYGQRLQRVVVFLRPSGLPFGSPSRTEGIRELCDGENASAVKLRFFLVRQSSQKAKVIFFDSQLAASLMKLAFSTMTVKRQLGWLRTGEQRGDFADDLFDLAFHFRGFDFLKRKIVAVHDAARRYGFVQKFR